MITGLRNGTMENLQLNAGAFFKNLDYSTATDADSLKTLIAQAMEDGENLLGATKGGGSFECTKTNRRVEADGMRSAYKGGEIMDDVVVKLKTTLLEITPENFQAALGSADVTTSTDKSMTTVRMRTSYQNKDYINSLLWVGDTNKGFCMIDLENALALETATLSFADKAEGTLPVEFTAHQADMLDQEYAPFKILFFESAAA